MKLLLDENLPHDLRLRLSGHDVSTVAFLGWAGVANGELLARAAGAGFDAVLTNDAGIAYQQSMRNLPVAVVILQAPTNVLSDLEPLLPRILAALTRLVPRTLVVVD